IMLKSDTTCFYFVLNPEILPILETNKAIDLLDQYHLHVKTIFVNKVLPEEADGTFLEQRRQHEKQYLKDIENTFPKQRKIYIPLLPHDITTLQELDAISEHYQL